MPAVGGVARRATIIQQEENLQSQTWQQIALDPQVADDPAMSVWV
jgi:hypothetical protein